MRRYSHLAILLAVTVGYVLLVLAVFPQTYWENDNIGILDDIRQGHTVSFMSVLLGRVLSFLYRSVSDAVPWYGLLLYAVTTAAFFLAAASVDALCRRRTLKYGFLAVLAVYGARFLVNASYNAASITIGFASLMALLVLLRRVERPRWPVVLGLGFLFSLTYLVRTGGLKAVGLFAALAVGWELATRFRSSWRSVVVFLLPLVVLGGIDAGLDRYGVSDEFRQFREWNRVRGSLHGFPILELNLTNEEILEANGWEPLHYSLFRAWAFFDERYFNLETIDNIRKYSVPLPGSNGPPVGLLIDNGLDLAVAFWPQWLAMGCLTALAYLGGRRRTAILTAAHILWILGGGTFMATYLRFPERISYALLFGALLLAFFLVCRDEAGPDAGDERPLPGSIFMWLTVLVLCSGLADARAVAGRIDETAERQRKYYAGVEVLRGLEPEILYISPGRAPGAECSDPLNVHHDRLPTVPAGWRIFSPRFYAYLRENGLEHGYQFLPYYVQRENAYVVSNKYFAELLSLYMWDAMAKRLKFVLVCELGDGLNVYAVRRGAAGRINKRGSTAPVVK